MLSNTTVGKLHEMKLSVMAKTFREQMEDGNMDSLAFEERFDIVNHRHKRASTIFCSQFAPEGWHGKIGEPAVADAICDRIVHDSYNIIIGGDGMRKRKGIKET